MRYVDLEGNISISSEPNRRVFLSYARHDEVARRLLSDLLEDLREDVNEPFAVQKVLVRQFKDAVDTYRDDRAISTRAKWLAHLAAAWRYLQNLDGAKWDAVADDLEDEIGALRDLCDPDDWGPHEDPSNDH